MLSETLAQNDSAVLDALSFAGSPSAETPGSPPLPINERSLLGLVELLLKVPARLDEQVRNSVRQAEIIPRLLILALTSFALFALVLALLLLAAEAGAVPFFLDNWNGSAGPAFALGLAYPIGMVAAAGICLPAFYFFGLLAGVRISMLQVAAHILKGQAATAVLLLGLTPIYLSVSLGMLIFHAQAEVMTAALAVGLALPFVAGLWGVRSIYVGFLGLADTLPPERRCRRTCFLRRLTAAWAAVYTAVTPVMIWSLYQNLAVRLG
ncbi:MAG TPA: hypothetical protein VMF69_23830 [Gemmataceae bacterium]|nr:hypothetical protein [Gemmataceae bacterium]